MPLRPVQTAHEGWSRAAAFALFALLTLAAIACREAGSATAATTSFERRDSVRLADDTFSILAKPVLASRSADGRVYIADASDKNIKVYDATGRRLNDIGSAGEGTDEFQQLTSAELANDRIVAYSFLTGILSRFTTDGAFLSATELDPAPFNVRVVDDSLLLLVRHPGQGGALLALARVDGRVQRRFFAPQLFEDYPELRFSSNVMADARHGYVHHRAPACIRRAERGPDRATLLRGDQRLVTHRLLLVLSVVFLATRRRWRARERSQLWAEAERGVALPG